jgi:CBS domain-containing protein
MRLREIMSRPAATILPTASATEARAAMERAGIRHLVVLGRARRIVGVVCAHDLRAAQPDSVVADLMAAPAVTLPAHADVQEAARLLRRHDVGSIPVIDGGRLVGMVTTSDLLGLLGKGALRVQPTPTKWTLPKRGPTHRPERQRNPCW